MAAPAEAVNQGPQGIDFDRLESHLRVLAHINRLELLSILRTPRTLDEIRLSPSAAQAGSRPDRPISRQAVQAHLDQMVELGLIRARSAERKGKRAHKEYVLDQSKLFALTEEFRQVGTLGAFEPVDPTATAPLPGFRQAAWEEGPKLVLAHGVDEGRVFYLRSTELKAPGRGWILGRDAGAHVALDYDPFVSGQNSEIVKDAQGGFELLDLRTARNGTFHNWQRLPPGGRVPLQSGDVVGAGRSLLVFRTQ